ncbi:MAG: DUF3365 domain-containing protein [Thermodesulfovibrionales bacterium]|nr:DUF3365 domain-containing protein [Thermodesulfovibrionales bacterium]
MQMRLNLSTKIIISLSVALSIALGITFYIIYTMQKRLIMAQIEHEARAIFRQIVITRQWIADHGGIFIEQKGTMKPNPYLEQSEIIDIQGKKYIRSSPAMVTKEISKYAKGMELYWFHITSLKLVNPENQPDEFEKRMLVEFANGSKKEAINLERINNTTYLRYVSPLFIEKPCLTCHGKQGYSIGEVRGAISVMIPIEKTLLEIEKNKKTMILLAVLTVVSVMSILFVILQKTVLIPMKRLKNSINDYSEGRYIPEKRLTTGDEFEDICNALYTMAQRISKHNIELSEKVKESTKELEEINQKLIQYNKILDESNKKKSDFIADVSHELRTPLTTIKGSMDFITAKLQNINTSCQSANELLEFCELIKKNCERLIRMVNTMLDIEKIESGVIETNIRPLELTNIINETITSLTPQAQEKGIYFKVDTSISKPVFADEDMIRQVLTNIISNAIKFSPEGSSILIKTDADETHLYTYVIDEGSGIDLEDKERIFDKFYKGKGRKDSSGLGLAICKSIIRLHDGIIGVKDRDDGLKGSCFYFALKILQDETLHTHS